MAITSNITALEAIVTWMNANQNKILLNDVSELVGQISSSITQTETALTAIQNSPAANDAGAVTQLSSITTGVTVNAPKGTITTVASTLAAGAAASFSVVNSFATATSVIGLSVDSSASTQGFVKLSQKTKAAGSFIITITNTHPTDDLNGLLKIDFTLN